MLTHEEIESQIDQLMPTTLAGQVQAFRAMWHTLTCSILDALMIERFLRWLCRLLRRNP